MPIPALLGDDEHTAADGPYARVLKVRKWLYIFGAIGLLLALNLYDPDAAHSIVKVLTVPDWLLCQAVAVGLAYMLLQYALLGGQLWRTYDIVLDERLTFRRADELASAIERANEARVALESYAQTIRKSALEKLDAYDHVVRLRRGAYEEKLESLLARTRLKDRAAAHSQIERYSTPRELDELDSLRKQFEDVAAEQGALMQQMEMTTDPSLAKHLDTQASALHEDFVARNADLKRLQSKDPAHRVGYKALEKAIDVLRIIPPGAFGFVALFRLLTA